MLTPRPPPAQVLYSYATAEELASAYLEEEKKAEAVGGGRDRQGESSDSFAFWSKPPSASSGSQPESPSKKDSPSKGKFLSGNNEVIMPFQHDHLGNILRDSGKVVLAGQSRRMQDMGSGGLVTPQFVVKSAEPMRIGSSSRENLERKGTFKINTRSRPGSAPARGRSSGPASPTSSFAGSPKKASGGGFGPGGGPFGEPPKRRQRPSSAGPAVRRYAPPATTRERRHSESSAGLRRPGSAGPGPIIPPKVDPRVRAELQRSSAAFIPTKKTSLIRPGSAFRGRAAPVSHGLTETGRTYHRTPTVEEKRRQTLEKKKRGFVLHMHRDFDMLHKEKFVVSGTRILGGSQREPSGRRPGTAPSARHWSTF